MDDPAGRVDCNTVLGSGTAEVDHLFHITALSADAGDEEGQFGAEFTEHFQLFRIGGAHHDTGIAVGVPTVTDKFCHVLEKRFAASDQILKVAGVGIGGAAEEP